LKKGFTLIELILAVFVSMLILSSIFSLYLYFTKLSFANQQQIQANNQFTLCSMQMAEAIVSNNNSNYEIPAKYSVSRDQYFLTVTANIAGVEYAKIFRRNP